MPRTTETRSVRDRNVFHEANARSRQAGKLAAKAAEKERLRLEQHAERMERLRLATERSGTPVEAAEEQVRELLLEGSIEDVADYLKVTVSTLTRWINDPIRKPWLNELVRDRGAVAGFAVKDIGRDDTRDPQHRAIDGKLRQWEAEKMNRQIFGSQPPPIEQAPDATLRSTAARLRDMLREIETATNGNPDPALDPTATPPDPASSLDESAPV